MSSVYRADVTIIVRIVKRNPRKLLITGACKMEISVTVVILGNQAENAKNLGYNAYYANGVTVIKVKHVASVQAAKDRMLRHGFSVLYAFE